MTRLRRTDSSRAGILRRRSGTGFTYRDVDGATITDPELRRRIDELAIPPAWDDVWIAPYPNGHIQAMGTDAAGRTQYLYHPLWREKKDRAKFDRMLQLAEALPTARRAVTLDLRRDTPDRARALAAAFRMLDTGSLRIGSTRYAEQNGSRGLTTLLCAHAVVHDDRVALKFPGKSGQEWSSELRDPDLAAVVRSLKRRGGRAHLLAFKESGRWHPLDAVSVNAYVRERTGGAFTAKDFRTLHGTVVAAASLAKAGEQPTATARRRTVAAAMRDVADELGNTPTVARASYVDPRVIDHFDHGRTIDPLRLGSAESQLRALLFS